MQLDDTKMSVSADCGFSQHKEGAREKENGNADTRLTGSKPRLLGNVGSTNLGNQLDVVCLTHHVINMHALTYYGKG